jgi:hypothetical protein
MADQTKTLRSINERARSGSSDVDLSAMLHFNYGFAHYNQENYAVKLPNEHLLRIKQLLTRQLECVETSLAAQSVAQQRSAAYRLLHDSLSSPTSLLPFINPALLDALRSPKPLGKLSRVVTEEAHGVYSLDLFSSDLCRMLLEEANNFATYTASSGPALRGSTVENALNRKQAVLDVMGLREFQDWIHRHVLQPLAALLFPSIAAVLDYRYGYIIGYTHKEAVTSCLPGGVKTTAERAIVPDLLTRSALVYHTDDSEITMNVCLGTEFEGGDLIIRGLRASKGEGKLEATISPRPGRAIVHLGQHLHEVTEVTSGERYAFIMWARNSAYRAQHCPCCLIFRREECICEPGMN